MSDTESTIARGVCKHCGKDIYRDSLADPTLPWQHYREASRRRGPRRQTYACETTYAEPVLGPDEEPEPPAPEPTPEVEFEYAVRNRRGFVSATSFDTEAEARAMWGRYLDEGWTLVRRPKPTEWKAFQ